MKQNYKKTLKKLASYALAMLLMVGFSVVGLGATAPTSVGYVLQQQQSSSQEIFATNAVIFPNHDVENDKLNTISPMGGTPIGFYTERVDFARRTQSGFVIPYATPTWLTPYTCGITAGAVVFGYYNKWVNNLIPNQMAGRVILNRWVWNGAGDGARALFSDLFRRMGGNPVGVTSEQYLSGMRSYANSRGRNITLNSLLTGHNQLNETQLKTALRSGQLVSLFVMGFSIVHITGGIQTFANHDIIRHGTNEGNHIMIAYGYRRIRYYNAANQLIRNDLYLYVHSGFGAPVHTLVPLYRFGTVYNAFVTHVF